MNWLLLQSPNPHSHLSSRYWIKVVWSLVITYWGSLFGFILDQRSLWLNFIGSSNFFFQMWRSSLVSFTLFFDLSEWKPWRQCMSVVAQDRQNVIYMYGGLLCQSELSCMRLIRPWFCPESVHCSSCIVVNKLCHTCILLCLPVDVFLNAIKRKKKPSTEEKGFL